MNLKQVYIEKIGQLLICALKKIGITENEENKEPGLTLESPPARELGDLAFPVFKYAKILKKSPPLIARDLINNIEQNELIDKLEVKGAYLNIFLNKKLVSKAIIEQVLQHREQFGQKEKNNQKIVIEFSSPNTNKPLHLGHCRNNVLGDSMARIYQKLGYDVIKLCLINDRGIHICKSMLAYREFGNDRTPLSENKKGDHFVGDYYIRYDQEARLNPDLEKQAQSLLIAWENKEADVIRLWKTLNQWAIEGIKETYNWMGIHFDYFQLESDKYLLGKNVVLEGEKKGIFYRQDNDSIWIDNEDVGLDKKLVLRSDGTSVYMTQDLGTAVDRYNEFKFDKMIYVVASEQVYHFKTLFAILKKLGFAWADQAFHLSYGMVNLREGKMKSREGTVVDADNLIKKLSDLAFAIVNEKQSSWEVEAKEEVAQKISLAALKYYLLNFSTIKDILFEPEKSISFDGNTGPYLQYTTARIHSLLKRVTDLEIEPGCYSDYQYNEDEWNLIAYILEFEDTIEKAAINYSPLEICNYLYQLTKYFNKFYHDNPIALARERAEKMVRIGITRSVEIILKTGLELLGIDWLEKM